MRQPSERGFSVAELIAIVAVVGVLFALGIPTFVSAWRASAVRAGAEEVATLLNGARQLALNRNEPVCVTLGAGTVQYRPGTCVATPVTQVRLASNVTVAVNQNLVFSYLGAGTPGTIYTVTNPQDGRTLSVNVSGSGRVSIGP
jgi:Tfp pilus assembly protein FimT